jgi:hypothetical protein
VPPRLLSAIVFATPSNVDSVGPVIGDDAIICLMASVGSLLDMDPHTHAQSSTRM